MSAIGFRLVPLLALAAAACAPSTTRVTAGAMWAALDGKVALQNSTGTLPLYANQQDLDDDLGVGDAATAPYLRLEAEWGPQRVRAHGFFLSESGSGTLSGQFGDLPSGLAVDTDMDFANVSASWSWDLVPGETFRLAPGAQLGWYDFDLSVTSTSPAGFERVETSALVPELYAEGEVDLGFVSLVGSVGFMALDAGDADGRWVDVDAMLRLMPTANIEIVAGVRYLVMDAYGEASSRPFDADIDLVGWFLGGGIRF